MKKNKLLLVIPVLFIAIMFFSKIKHVDAEAILIQDIPTVDYKDQPSVDTDSDGLTDEGEKQIYKTDPNKADTDGDSIEDGVEVLANTNPLDPSVYPGMIIKNEQTAAPEQETPWAWYSSRTSGLVAFFLLWVSIFLGLTLRVPFLRKIISPIYSMSVHCWISVYATLFALFHGVVLTFDKMFHISLTDVLIPFSSNFEKNLMALGIFAFYLMVILVATSYARNMMSQRIWRITHFTNIILYVLVLLHAVQLGTDMKNPIVFNVFLWMNAFLILVMLFNAELRISEVLKRRSQQSNITPPPVNSTL
jgi:hypothetical protein